MKHIVFDIGRVLIHYDPELPFRRLIPDDDKRRWFLDHVCSPDWNREQDRGRDWQEAEALLIDNHPEEEHLIRAFRQNWIEMIPHAVKGSAEIVAGLKEAGHDVTMLTNFNQETFPLARERYDVLNLARGVTVSGELGLLKPDVAIYQHHAKAFALDPGQTIFFDDSQANVDGAKAAGWEARLFTDAVQMRRDLHEAGCRF
ncbi:MAG: HAD family phosphatase [Pseudomonadota bacterium]